MTTGRPFRWTHAALLLVGYVALDWASYFHPLHDLNITPWNPAAALGVVFMVRHGWRAALPIPAAIAAGDAWVRVVPASFVTVTFLAVLLAAGYFGIAMALRRALKDNELFDSRRGLLVWMLIVAAGTLATSLAFCIALVLFGLIPASNLHSALAGHWIGDCVGIIVAMPLMWLLSADDGRAAVRHVAARWEIAAILVATVLAIWLAFGLGGKADYKYFYVLFLPTIWGAARFGFIGAALVAAFSQVGIAIGINYLDFAAVTAFEIQVLTVVLAGVGFLLGIVIDEQRRISGDLRQSLRLAAAGEMAGAIAHELNQPLTAISAYGSTCEELLARGRTGDEVREAVQRIVRESRRAADVVRRLRDFFRTGSTRLELLRVGDLVTTAAEPFVARAAREGVAFTVSNEADCGLLADRLQLEVVLRNLLANAFDAVSALPEHRREVTLSTRPAGPGRLCIAVRDSGPGLPADVHARLYEPFRSTKTNGLGLGLAISRAIAEAHGGRLRAKAVGSGNFELLLPIEEDAPHADK